MSTNSTTKEDQETQDIPRPSLTAAMIPIVFMAASLGLLIGYFETDPHLPLFLSAVVAAAVALATGCRWKQLEVGIMRSIGLTTQAIVILLIIGTIIGYWIAGGVVPTMIYYGLSILAPDYFLVAACLICCVVSLAGGNAWTAAGTIGIALMGVGEGLGINPAMVAGAVISGVYFGDKISPLSETTNMASGVVGVDLFEHIRYMLYTTVPAISVALVLYTIIGLSMTPSGDGATQVIELQQSLNELFIISPWLLLVPALVIVMMVKKVPAIPALSIGSLMGFICAIVIQGVPLGDSFTIFVEGYAVDTGNEAVDELLTNGGVDSMMWTVSLIIIAMSFGGILESAGFFRTIVESLLKLAKTTGSLIATTVATSMTANVVGCDQYLSIILPARMYASEYKRRALKLKNLSRTVEDAGTMTSPLVPWNTCGAFMFATLGVSAFSYAPYAFLALLSPVFAIIYGFTGFKIAYENESARDEPASERAASGA
ncbi:Na+/H+ antiporter NhaC [Vreelandella nigrificans]|uniref:Na+/H+ antiporter NhaC n=1 Tax=Vreelandella nigrificans TaxID=2042704 RepID=A0A2A4HIQ4_9GAMM|nr:Na+/H+ antiporter NhaC [Halomonas nigrificans]PCF93963.1 Na+/H+ antiporter NhaC [Halomonas nigrificans]